MYITFDGIVCSEVLECFRRHELLEWTLFQTKYGLVLQEGVPDCPATDVFTDSELGKEHWEDLRKRVIEHVSETAVICVCTVEDL